MVTQRRLSVDRSAYYTVTVQGRLPEGSDLYFEDMHVETGASGPSVLTALSGQVADQAALQGLLQKLYMLGMPLRSVSLDHF